MTVKELLKDIKTLKSLGYITDDYSVMLFDQESGHCRELQSIIPNGLALQMTSQAYEGSIEEDSDEDIHKYADELWEHRNDKYGHDVDIDGVIWNVCKGADLIALDRENGVAEDDRYPFQPDVYYLSKDSIYVYKVGSAEDIKKVLEGNGTEFFEFC